MDSDVQAKPKKTKKEKVKAHLDELFENEDKCFKKQIPILKKIIKLNEPDERVREYVMAKRLYIKKIINSYENMLADAKHPGQHWVHNPWHGGYWSTKKDDAPPIDTELVERLNEKIAKLKEQDELLGNVQYIGYAQNVYRA